MANLGARIKRRREDLHMKQSQLATKTGLSRALISQMENNVRTNPRISTLGKIAWALGVSPEALLCDVADNTKLAVDRQREIVRLTQEHFETKERDKQIVQTLTGVIDRLGRKVMPYHET